jgi:uncharacterized membrane protein YccC
MSPAADSTLSRLDGQAVRQSALSAVAAAASWVVARWLGFPEAYWAVTTTLIVAQSMEDANATVSLKRLAGTILGVVAGAMVAELGVNRTVSLPVSIFVLGLSSATFHLGKPAYRFAGIGFVIVALPQRIQSPLTIAFHRLFEVAIGIGVGLLLVRGSYRSD